jgi:CheY-like chemotaxis protein
LKYTPRGTISIRLEAADQAGISDETLTRVRLIVEDTGSGISESFLANDLFTPFKQEDSHSTGTGLGLNIVKQIADSMGANIHVESEAGKGTKVTVTFDGSFTESKSLKRRSASDKPSVEETWEIGLDHFVLLSPMSNSERPEKPQINAVGKSVLRTCHEWLKSDALAAADFELISGTNVCAVTEEDLLLLVKSNRAYLSSTIRKINSQGAVLLVLGSSIQALSLREHVLQLDLEPLFVHQPIGPRKLLRAIATKTSSSTPLAALDSKIPFPELGLSTSRRENGSPNVSLHFNRDVIGKAANVPS